MGGVSGTGKPAQKTESGDTTVSIGLNRDNSSSTNRGTLGLKIGGGALVGVGGAAMIGGAAAGVGTAAAVGGGIAAIPGIGWILGGLILLGAGIALLLGANKKETTIATAEEARKGAQDTARENAMAQIKTSNNQLASDSKFADVQLDANKKQDDQAKVLNSQIIAQQSQMDQMTRELNAELNGYPDGSDAFLGDDLAR